MHGSSPDDDVVVVAEKKNKVVDKSLHSRPPFITLKLLFLLSATTRELQNTVVRISQKKSHNFGFLARHLLTLANSQGVRLGRLGRLG